MTKLAGQTIVITGASSGIGAEAARTVARLGATVCVLARRADELEDVRAGIEAEGGNAYAYAVPPAASMLVRTSSSSSSRRASRHTVAPSRATLRAASAPIPLEAPVMTMV